MDQAWFDHRCEGGLVQVRVLGGALEDRQDPACHDSLHEASVREDLSLGGFMARIVIKPNS